jgi:hypothetical protein
MFSKRCRIVNAPNRYQLDGGCFDPDRRTAALVDHNGDRMRGAGPKSAVRRIAAAQVRWSLSASRNSGVIEVPRSAQAKKEGQMGLELFHLMIIHFLPIVLVLCLFAVDSVAAMRGRPILGRGGMADASAALAFRRSRRTHWAIRPSSVPDPRGAHNKWPLSCPRGGVCLGWLWRLVCCGGEGCDLSPTT